jgi:hypothetical protein
MLQPVRVLDVPPSVNEPVPHVLQLLEPATALYLLLAPHGVFVPVPAHFEPAGQAEHEYGQTHWRALVQGVLPASVLK